VLTATGTSSTLVDTNLQINGDTSSAYSFTRLYGTGSVAASDRSSNQTSIKAGDFSTVGSTNIMQIMNYANTTTNKTILFEGSSSASANITTTGLWRSTAAISSITLFIIGGATFSSGATFNLYGIANATTSNLAKATGGDSVYTDGTYWYHTFLSSGTFTPSVNMTTDYLVVAGGGGGGNGFTNSGPGGGGGGAGGLRCTVGATGGGGSLESALSLTALTNYTVTVGAGGAQDTNGSNSVFSTITSTGGGAGGSGGGSGNTGGSGGGPSAGTTGRSAVAGTANQGYASGNTILGPQNNYACAGGGGAGGVGGNGSTGGVSGAGGAGVQTSISGTATYYAAGGSGGVGQFAGTSNPGSTNNIGGIGAYGTGGTNVVATSGVANTGSGGGGAYDYVSRGTNTAGSGGSGIVIVRYAV
jgi:hypothetical protein